MDETVKAFAARVGVSVRTLHHYHDIGLLPPSRVDGETGYRYYNEESFLRMQRILFYRELGFSLTDIRALLQRDADSVEILAKHKRLLQLKKQRLEGMIEALDRAQNQKEEFFFMENEYEALRGQYAEEVKARWGETEVYKEYEKRGNPAAGTEALNAVFAEFAAVKAAGESPESEAAAAVVGRLQQTVTAHFYTCTKEILAGLGAMYTADERFANNIDKNGAGTAEFASAAIAAFCR